MPEMMSKYISGAEFRCSHCGALPPDCVKDESGDWPMFYDALFYRVDHLRETWGRPIVFSGYRCPDHEFEISGSRLGPHIFGAIDAAITVEEQPQFVVMVENNHPEMRMGVNTKPGQTHVHLDMAQLMRPRYSLALEAGMRWTE